MRKLLSIFAFSVLLLVLVGAQNAFAAVFTDSFDISPQEIIPFSLAFNTDGTKMFVMGIVGDDVNEYSLPIAFDVSSVPDQAVGGSIIPIDTTSLLLAGTQMTASWMIPAIIAAIGIGIVIARKF